MISNLLILAEGAGNTLFSDSPALLLPVYAFVIILTIIAVIIFIRFLNSGMKEMKLMRMEIGKLAEELRLLRNELEEHREVGSSTQ